MGDMDSIHGSLDSLESSTQNTSRSVEPFLQCSLLFVILTGRPLYLVCHKRLHLHMHTLMQPNNKAKTNIKTITLTNQRQNTNTENQKHKRCTETKLI